MIANSTQQKSSKHCFISYDEANHDWAEWIAWQVEAAGIASVSFAPWDVTPGSNRVLAMNEAIQKSDHVLVVLSPAYLKAVEKHPAWTTAFIQDIAGRQRMLVPLIVCECRPALSVVIGLGPLTTIDLVDVDETTARKRLLDGIGGVRGKPKEAPAFPPTVKKPTFPGGAIPLYFSGTAQTNRYQTFQETPPLTDPRSIHQRVPLVTYLYEKLRQPDITGVVVTGIGGVGKSTLAALVYNYVEAQRNTDTTVFTGETLWLNMYETTTLLDLAFSIFSALKIPIAGFAYLPPPQQAEALSQAMYHSNERRVIVLNQFEKFLNWQNGSVLSLGVGEWLDLLNRRAHHCKVLLTSRIWPKGSEEEAPTCMQEYLDHGMDVDEGVELLRTRGVERKQATDEALRTFVVNCAGHALALTLLASILQRDQALTLKDVIDDHASFYAQSWHGDIARRLLDFIYTRQLDSTQQKLLRAFSVYREPVSLAGAEILMGKLSPKKLFQAFEALHAQHLLQDVGEKRYQLHSFVASYAQKHFNSRNERANERALQSAHVVVAQYYRDQPVPPQASRRYASDIQPLLEAIWHWCEAQQWQEAYSLIDREKLFVTLRRWGENAMLLELCKCLSSSTSWKPENEQEATLYKNLGRVYADLALHEQAQGAYERALTKFKEMGDSNGEGTTLNNIGRSYHALGQNEVALQRHQAALQIFQVLQDQGGQGTTLTNMGACYRALGKQEQARTCYEEALGLFRIVGYLAGQARTLNDLGRLYADSGLKEDALKFYEEAWQLYQEVGDRRGEGWVLHNLGLLHYELGQSDQAWRYFYQALHIRREVGNRWGEGAALHYLGQLLIVKQCYSSALACLLEAQKLFIELHHVDQKTVQYSFENIQQILGEQQFTAQVEKVSANREQLIAQVLDEEFHTIE